MKNSVWYDASYNEILVKPTRNSVERGRQASVQIPGQSFSVPDYLVLFRWKVNLKEWKDHIAKGWLVKLGEL